MHRFVAYTFGLLGLCMSLWTLSATVERVEVPNIKTGPVTVVPGVIIVRRAIGY